MSGVTETLPVSAGEYFASSPTQYRRCWSDCVKRWALFRASDDVRGCSSNRQQASAGGSFRCLTSGSKREAIACLRTGARRPTRCRPLRSRERLTGGGLGRRETRTYVSASRAVGNRDCCTWEGSRRRWTSPGARGQAGVRSTATSGLRQTRHQRKFLCNKARTVYGFQNFRCLYIRLRQNKKSAVPYKGSRQARWRSMIGFVARWGLADLNRTRDFSVPGVLNSARLRVALHL
jgi:hypothetical protein